MALPHGVLCVRCRHRLHYHPAACPGCAQVRPLGYRDAAGAAVCAGCAGQPSVFACAECGREDHPYRGRRCARCLLRERLTRLLNDPATQTRHHQLRPLFDTLIAGDRPQTTIYWLRRPPGRGPELLGRMARGEVAISHDTFDALPTDRAHTYLRDLLAAVGVLPPYQPGITRMQRWLDDKLVELPEDHATIIGPFARWQVLRHLHQQTRHRTITLGMTNTGRAQIIAAIRLLSWAAEHGTTIAQLTQPDLETYLDEHPAGRYAQCRFVGWLNTSGTNPHLTLTYPTPAPPQVTLSDADRWGHVERLLHDDTIRPYTRIAGLFMLLFAQPLAVICAMRTDQVRLHPDDTVTVTFDTDAIQLPDPLDDLVRQHLTRRGQASYVARDNGWLFPGGIPGRHLNTENIRSQLVERGIQPSHARNAAMFDLAAQIPVPVLADLLGIATSTATRWAALAAKDWSRYIADRTHHGQPT